MSSPTPHRGTRIPRLGTNVRLQPHGKIAAAGGLDREALAAVGIDLDAVRETADATFGEGALDRAGRRQGGSGTGHIPFARDGKKALELALREAIRLREKEIGGRVLLLGIVRDEQSPGARVLRNALEEVGSDLLGLRAALGHVEAA
ncbi:Clp protease N-terminal domain-containing protein [Myceligenerans crystallogenes]|uniref:Clp R domain-containing protein n=1 Tax=Myceligenerans crystallogenes TaxID=316335 RepID=A0ABN2NJD7_9MICO